MKKDHYKERQELLDFGEIYHIYNRAVGNELLFITKADYIFFLKKLDRFILPIANIYSYCLIPNHFHLLIKIKEAYDFPDKGNRTTENSSSKELNQPFSNLFNSYSKSFNKIHNRMGRLFIQPFKRIKVETDNYTRILINYIHRNPIHHGITKNFEDWKYSSYNACISDIGTKIDRQQVLSYFGSIKAFIKFHEENKSPNDNKIYFSE